MCLTTVSQKYNKHISELFALHRVHHKWTVVQTVINGQSKYFAPD